MKIWNHETFGNIHNNLKNARLTLEQTQSDLENLGYSDERYEAEILAQKSLNDAQRVEHEFLKEKARVKWIHEGDRNTAFFHRIVNSRRANNSIRAMDINGSLCWDPNSIKDHIKDFYEKLFTENKDNPPNFGIIKDVIPELVTAADNYLLVATPSNEEIRRAVFSLDPNSAPGPDGFNGSFFQHCWDIVGSDVCEGIKDFFRTGRILENLNSNFLVLIPKSEGASSIGNFRPIVLSNFLFKIITKILAERLSGIAA